MRPTAPSPPDLNAAAPKPRPSEARGAARLRRRDRRWPLATAVLVPPALALALLAALVVGQARGASAGAAVFVGAAALGLMGLWGAGLLVSGLRRAPLGPQGRGGGPALVASAQGTGSPGAPGPPSHPPPPRDAARAAAPAAPPILSTDIEPADIDLTLQPILSLPARETIGFTARAAPRSPAVAGGPADLACAPASTGLDLLMLRRSVSLLRILAQESPHLLLFCPTSSPALHDPDYLALLNTMLAREGGVARRLVLELCCEETHGTEAGSGGDLARLRRLGLKLCLAAPARAASEPPAPGWVPDFVKTQADRLRRSASGAGAPLEGGSRLILTNVRAEADLQLAPRVALAEGDLFAAPRAVSASVLAHADREWPRNLGQPRP